MNMKKGNKKLLVVALLLLLVVASYGTYAIYKSSATGNTTANVAAWAVTVNNTDIVASDTLSGANIVWNTNENVKAGKIAPGSTGTLTITIDASASEVGVNYDIELGDITVGGNTVTNSELTIAPRNAGDDEGSIAYSDTAANMVKTVVYDVTWNAVDSTSQNTADMALKGAQISIPVTVTATQKTA